MRTGTLRHFTNILLFLLCAVVLSGCFQAASDSSNEPSVVNLTSIATLVATPTPFITPLSTGGFVVQETPTISIFPPTATPGSGPETGPTLEQQPTQEPLPPTAVPPQGGNPPVTATLPVVPTTGSAENVSLATPTALPTEGPCIHTVQPGEWLASIARKYGVSTQDLLASNPTLAGNPDRLSPGDVLNIPDCNKPRTPTNPPPPPTAQSAQSGQPGQPGPTETNTPGPIDSTFPTPIPVEGRTYTVVKGDTMSAIARKFGITVQQLKDANGIKEGDFIRIGQVLKIPAPLAN